MSANRKTTSKKPTVEQIAKRKAQMDRFDAQIEKRNIKNHEALAFGIVGLVAQNPRIEWEIVSNYLERKNRVMVDKEQSDREFYAKYPQFAPKAKHTRKAA